MAELEQVLKAQNAFMVAFDLALGTGALLAPDRTLGVLFGHERPSDDARELFRRCAPIWLTFAAAHAVAAVRGEPRDWWALAWLRGTEIATDALWSRSDAFKRPGARAGMWYAGAANLAMALGFAKLAARR
ncbi:MAG: hypothetical protein QOJ12_1815 [Thermoleophilales bacterium]|nr:hypothetical protein [Thermoleophilales bacterium]